MMDDIVADDSKKVEAPAKGITPEEFLGPNAKLVDFDDLISKPTPASECSSVSLSHCKYYRRPVDWFIYMLLTALILTL